MDLKYALYSTLLVAGPRPLSTHHPVQANNNLWRVPEGLHLMVFSRALLVGLTESAQELTPLGASLSQYWMGVLYLPPSWVG